MDVIRSSVYMLDTNMASYIVSGRSKAARTMLKESMVHSRVTLSAVTQAEVLFGLENKPATVRLRSAIEELCSIVEVLSWDSAAARSYGKLRARLAAAGKSLSAMDMLIAAHAIAIGATLVTRDQAFLQAAPFLDVADWATDL